MSSQKTSSRSIRLRLLFTTVIKGEKPIEQNNAKLFLEAICDQDNRAVCVQRLQASEHGRAAFQSAISSNTEVSFLQGPITDLLLYLSGTDIKTVCGGTVLRQLLASFMEAELVWTAFVSAFKSGDLHEKGEDAFSWILLEILSLPKDKANAFISLAKDEDTRKRLLESKKPQVRQRAHRILHIIENMNAEHSNHLDGPGGRHDNDFNEIDKISIIPTADELSSKDPYLPRASETKAFSKTPNGIALHLDSQFRLLREDMVRDMREEIHATLNMQKGKRRAFSIDHLTLVGVHCDGKNPWTLQLQCMNDLSQLPNKSEAIRRRFLDQNPKFLKHESLACIITDDQVATLGTLIREEDFLVKKPPIICVHIPAADLAKSMRLIKEAKVVRVVQLNTALFSYAPVLKQLQEMKELPFEEEILRCSGDTRPKPLNYPLSRQGKTMVAGLLQDSSFDIQDTLSLPKSTRLDKSQVSCFLSALLSRLSLIQGPPGTGKSFIGALIAKAIFCQSQEIILILTFKHHALDQFIEDLLKLGIPRSEIVRLGSSKKAAQSVQDLSMRNVVSSERLTREQRDMLDLTKRSAQDEGNILQQAFSGLNQQSPSKLDILDYLEFLTDGPPFFEAFQIPTRKDGTTYVGKKGRAIDKFYLLDKWCRGKDPAPFTREAQKYADVWNIRASERNKLQKKWEADILQERLDAVQSAGQSYNEHLDEIQSIYMERELRVLRSRRIIACTTTAAAKYVRKLSSVNPGIVLVEEAGEILESHVLTALNPKTKQLILIGDHKQLRPKVNHALSVEKDDGYDLNRSLFERLLLSGYPHHTLHQQHRMRPELSQFVRELTYPNLVDAAGTKSRPNIKGLQDNIIFLNHEHQEEQMQNVRDWKDGSSPSSKKNLFEIHMAIKCLRYLGQQDIASPLDKIVILTPYLGQLHLLREELSKDNDPVINDLDKHDLVRAGLVPPASSQANKPRIKISTIDNFQGDESEIVIVSLTRSNPHGDIGFMYSPERLNVLLSRARNSLILIGNKGTFLNSKKGGQLWHKFFDMLENRNHIYEGLPVKCEQHPTRISLLRSPEEFDQECPDGGCRELCGAALKCGKHQCPRSCHYRSDHSKMRCGKFVDVKCPQGHVYKEKCGEVQQTKCQKCEREDEMEAEKVRRDMALQHKRLREQVKHDLEIQEIEKQIQKIRDEAEDAKTAEERLRALSQKKQDLQAAQQYAKTVSEEAARRKSNTGSSSPSGAPPTRPPSTIGTPPNEKRSKAPEESGSQNPNVPKSSTQNLNAPTKSSASELEWKRQKKIEGANNDAIDDLMALTGLEDVKEKFLDIKSKIETVQRQQIDMKKERMGMVMLGNPGTGKTTVARIYARFLASVKALPGKEFVEITGSGLANEGVAGAKKMIEGLVKAGGGVFFIDEAYQLACGNNYAGKNVLDFILAEIEERRGTIAFILAGYVKEMEQFFEHNPGFDSRMPHRLTFADYSDAELLVMLDAMVTRKYNGRATLEDGGYGLYARILIKRLGRRRGKEGYGNARALENEWARVTERQASRLRKERVAGGLPDDLAFIKEDIIGPEPSGAIRGSTAWKELQGLVGLEKVKNSVKALVDATQRNYQRELRELEPLGFTLHRVFLGSPGTGKTTVARLYGSILADMGLLSKREVVLKNPSDFVGSALGQSEENTKNILKAAAGKVLVIDEAYGLDAGGGVGNGNKDPYKIAVIDTIVAEVQNTPGEDLCVLLLGYQEQMEEMMNNANPGLARRFRLSDAFYFEDFTDENLLRVLNYKLKKQGLKATDEAKRVALEVLARERDRPNFGNAGAVENMISRAKELEQKRTSAVDSSSVDPDITFFPQDFDEDHDRAAGADFSVQNLFADIVGCEPLIAQLGKYQQIVKNMRAHGRDPRSQIPFNFLFKGPPGTGKTTVARKISELYYNMGILGTNQKVECSASDLIGQYIGQTGPKTQAKLNEALGRVLFIDEAYRFCDSHFGKEAINELVDCLTKEKYMGKIVVILAGYTNQIDELLQINPGLSSRFPEEVVFENMAPEQCLDLLCREIKKENISIRPPVELIPTAKRQPMLDLFGELSKLESWGNGRDVKNLAKRICSDVFANTAAASLEVSMADILKHLEEMLKSQQARNTVRKDSLNPEKLIYPNKMPTPTERPPPLQPKVTEMKTNMRMAPPKAVEEITEENITPEMSQSRHPTRDPGVSQAIWDELQRAIAEDKALKQAEEMFLANLRQECEAQKEAEIAKQKEIRRLEEAKREADEARRKQIEEEICAEQAHIAAVLKARKEAEDRIRRAKEEAERKVREEAAVQKKIKDMGICPAGYQWIKTGGGYRCAGGSHFLTNAQLGV